LIYAAGKEDPVEFDSSKIKIFVYSLHQGGSTAKPLNYLIKIIT